MRAGLPFQRSHYSAPAHPVYSAATIDSVNSKDGAAQMVGGTLTPQEFVTKWRGAQLSERASVQEHFLNLCILFGQPSPADADPTGSWYTFEKGVTKTGGGQGFADVWKRGFFAWEYKKKKRDLGEAFKQLLLYRIPLENPPLLVVCDIDRYEIHTNFTGTAEKVYRFTNEQIVESETLRVLRALFDNPEALRSALTIQQVTEDAARRFASLADGLRARGIEPQRAAHFLTQLLFCLFAEDVGLLPPDTFGEVVRFGVRRPESFLRNVTTLFMAMRDGGEANLHEIERFNGGLFAAIDPLALTPPELATLAQAAALDWGSVDTAIIGTLFERSLDPGKRAQLGAHYTGRPDILRVVEPVVLAPLRREWEVTRAAAEALRLAAEAALTPQTRRNRQAELTRLLLAFKERLAGVTILDPACGSAISSPWRSARCSTWRRKSSPTGRRRDCPRSSPRLGRANCAGWRSTPTRISWRRWRSGSPTSNG